MSMGKAKMMVSPHEKGTSQVPGFGENSLKKHSAPVLGWVSSEAELRKVLSIRVLFGGYHQDTAGVEWDGKMGKSLSKACIACPMGVHGRLQCTEAAPIEWWYINSQTVSTAVIRGEDQVGTHSLQHSPNASLHPFYWEG